VKKKLLLVLFAPLMGVLALMPHDSFAASQTANLTFSGSGGATSVLSALAVCDECAPDAFFTDPDGILVTWGLGAGIGITAKASWNNPAPVNLQYSAGNLRHGSTLDLTDTLTPGAGTVGIAYTITGTVGVYGSAQSGSLSCATISVTPTTCNGWVATTDSIDIPISESDSIPCTMPLPGESPRNCTKTKTITLWNADLFGIASVEIDLILDEQVTVTGSGVSSLRLAVVNGGTAIPNNNLTFSGTSPSTVADPIAISCTQPVGSDLLYSLTNNQYTAEPAIYSGDIKFALSATILGIGVGYTTPPLVSSSGADLGPIPMSAPNQQVDLGPVLANATPPTANAGGPYSGVEGSPVSFNGTGSTSVCGASSLSDVWNFSDGGVAYGTNPQHTFEAPGIYSGQLTVTDPDGLTNTADFSVTISNLAPVVTAGPDMSTPWGVPITLNGSAVDPGTDEQPFLTYSWNFGDGTPSASGGASVNHVYSNPGTYTATFTACDPEAACASGTMNVVVRNRNTTASYTGAVGGAVTDAVPLQASLVDEFGQAVVGRTVAFAVDGSPVGSAMTNSSGVARFMWTIPLGMVGSHTVGASFVGDSMYNLSAAGPATFLVDKEITVVKYTGPSSSSPSKAVNFTAVLKDDEGNPIAGKILYFTLGTGTGAQSCNGTTNASGVASCTITKLTLNPGNYLIVSAFPNGDPNYYGSSDTEPFKVGK